MRRPREALRLCGIFAVLAVVSAVHAAPSAPRAPGDVGDSTAFPDPSVASGVGPAFRCAGDEDCSDGWQVALGMLVATGCIGGIAYIVRRAQRPPSLHLVSLLVALDASGESIKSRLSQPAPRAKLPTQEGLRQAVQRACGVLLEYHGAWTHAGTQGPMELLGARAFSKWRSELGTRGRAHHASYHGTHSYTVVGLLLSTRDRPPPLSAPGHRQVEDYLRALSRLHPEAFEVVCLPTRDRLMTLRELIDRYPELFPLDVYSARAKVG
jgi:Protein of unknown function (DUF1517)